MSISRLEVCHHCAVIVLGVETTQENLGAGGAGPLMLIVLKPSVLIHLVFRDTTVASWSSDQKTSLLWTF